MSLGVIALVVRGRGVVLAEVALVEGRAAIVGRDPAVDLPVDDDRVSRRHLAARLEPGGTVLLEDLASTNGSFVGGERIERARVRAGSRFVVGGTVVEVEARDRAPAPRPRSRSAPRPPEAEPWLAGRLEAVPLFVLLQLAGEMKMSGLLAVEGPRRGRLHVAGGRIAYAAVDGLPAGQPEKAVFRMLSWTRGRFALHPSAPTLAPGALELHLEALLLEGHRELDELARLAPSLPAPERRVYLVRAAPGEPLDPAEALVSRLASSGPTFAELLDQAPLTDLRAGEAVLRLLLRGVLALG